MELKHYFSIVWKRLWILMVLPFVAGCISIYYTMNLTPYYTANTTLYVVNAADIIKNGMNYNQVIVGEYLTKDYAELIRSRTVAEAVIREMGLKNASPEYISGKISVTALNDTRVLQISYTDTNPEKAGKITNEVAKQFSRKAIELMKVDTVSIIDKAHTPGSPSGPNKNRYIILALLSAFILAGGIIFLLEYLDNTIKTSEDVEKYLGLSVIGTVPMLDMK